MIMMAKSFLKPYEVELDTPMHVQPGPLEHVTESGPDNPKMLEPLTHTKPGLENHVSWNLLHKHVELGVALKTM